MELKILHFTLPKRKGQWAVAFQPLILHVSLLFLHFCNPIVYPKRRIMAATLSLLKSPITMPYKSQCLKCKLQSPSPSTSSSSSIAMGKDTLNPLAHIRESTVQHLRLTSLPLTAITLPLLLDAKDALAVDGEFGILEGRALALVHPVVMGGLFLYTLWSGFLGWQWRRVRTIQNEINELKKQVQPVAVTSDGKPVSDAPLSSVEAKIQQLTEERKELLKGNYRDRHFHAGSILLGFGIFESVGGGLNTWFRTGKLFPGPHLFAGTAVTVLWAAAAALVPAMQKGSETARNLHIALNTINVVLFIWQIPTGFEIVLKVLEFTKWP